MIKTVWAYSGGEEEGDVPDEVEEADETPQAPTSLIMEDIENSN